MVYCKKSRQRGRWKVSGVAAGGRTGITFVCCLFSTATVRVVSQSRARTSGGKLTDVSLFLSLWKDVSAL